MWKDLNSELKDLKNARDYFLTRINYETNDYYLHYFTRHLDKVLTRINEIEQELNKNES